MFVYITKQGAGLNGKDWDRRVTEVLQLVVYVIIRGAIVEGQEVDIQGGEHSCTSPNAMEIAVVEMGVPVQFPRIAQSSPNCIFRLGEASTLVTPKAPEYLPCTN